MTAQKHRVMQEINVSGLIGPTHNYGGLSLGNIASSAHAGTPSSPRRAALQSLRMMLLLHEMGVTHVLLPPLERPKIPFLRAFGYTGSDDACIKKVHRDDPALLTNIFSAASMWSANAATFLCAQDTHDAKPHFVPANLSANLHRSLETEETARFLRLIFPEEKGFIHHVAVPGGVFFGDEGAANHMRIAQSHADTGLNLFVYGEQTHKFPPRQSKRASMAVARSCGIDKAMFLMQNPAAVDAGVFHNDVIAVCSEQTLFLHEKSFAEQPEMLRQIREAAPFVQVIEIEAKRLSIKKAVACYLFNSQLIKHRDRTILVAPRECETHPQARAILEEICGNDRYRISGVRFVEVDESMQNGGGPACLRLRVQLDAEAMQTLDTRFVFTARLYEHLEQWIKSWYRDRLVPDDFRDPLFRIECYEALDALTTILGTGSLYAFQKAGGDDDPLYKNDN